MRFEAEITGRYAMSTPTIFRTGIIGGGAIAQACHAPGYARNVHSVFAAVCDPDPARLRELEKAYPNVRTYTDHREMLKQEHLNAVSVCSPNKLHVEHTLDALKAGCHVLCEKPMATTVREADKMIDAAKSARRKLMIGFTHRLFSGPKQCKQLLDAKAIGKPFMLRVRFAHGGPYPGWAKSKWFYDPNLAAGGALLDMGIHAIDLSLWLMGPIVSVSARTATLIKRIPVDDNAILLLEFASGALGYIEVGWTSKPGFVGCEIYGSEGSLICDYLKGLYAVGGTESPSGKSNYDWRNINATPTEGGWRTEIDYWMDVVRGEEKLTMDGKAGREALRVALAAYESSKTAKRISLAKKK